MGFDAFIYRGLLVGAPKPTTLCEVSLSVLCTSVFELPGRLHTSQWHSHTQGKLQAGTERRLGMAFLASDSLSVGFKESW